MLGLLIFLKLLGLPHNVVDNPGEGRVGVNVAREQQKQYVELRVCSEVLIAIAVVIQDYEGLGKGNDKHCDKVSSHAVLINRQVFAATLQKPALSVN